MWWSTLLLMFSLVLFVLAAWPVPSRFNLIAAGLACYVAARLADTLMP